MTQAIERRLAGSGQRGQARLADQARESLATLRMSHEVPGRAAGAPPAPRAIVNAWRPDTGHDHQPDQSWRTCRVFIDVFRSPDLSGWAKALWFLFVLFILLIGVLAYLIARCGTMHERSIW